MIDLHARPLSFLFFRLYLVRRVAGLENDRSLMNKCLLISIQDVLDRSDNILIIDLSACNLNIFSQ